LYITQTNATDIAKQILELSRGETIEYTVASPDMWHKRGAGYSSNGVIKGESIADMFMDAGVWLEKADNERVLGWTRMREFMKIQPDGKPLWMIFNNCTNLIRTLPQMIHDDRRVEDVADRLEDHAVESCRYGLMSRPQAVQAIVSTTEQPKKDNEYRFVVQRDGSVKHSSEIDDDMKRIATRNDDDSSWFKRMGW
jgi:hypothetical protein